MIEDEEDNLVAEAAAAAAAQAESMNPPTSRSLLKQSSSFRPHMHVQMQALSAHRIDPSLSARYYAGAIAAALVWTVSRILFQAVVCF